MEGLIFAPLMGLVGQMLRGRVVVDSTALVGFFLSPLGLFATFFAAVSFLMIRVMEQAGLSVLRAEEFGGTVRTPASAMTFVLSHVMPLLRASCRFIVLAAGMLTPFLVITGLIARHLLSRHDINFYLAERPTDFLMWGGVIVVVAVITLGVLVWNMIRWRWVVNAILFENKIGAAAFKRSAELVKGFEVKIALQWAGIGVLNVGLGIISAWIGRLLLPIGAALLGESITSLGALVGFLIVLQALIGAVILVLGPIVEAQIFTRGYFDRSGIKLSGQIETSPAHSSHGMPSWFTPVLLLGLLSIGGVIGGIRGTEALSLERPVKVIAHRGATGAGPENSAPAFEQAIKDGADVLETDVQLTKDGEVVVIHDSDFSRLAGVAKKVSDLTWDEMRKIDIGEKIEPQFRGVHTLRLIDLLSLAGDRVKLNIELKHYAPVDGQLEKKVVDLIQRYGFLPHIEIQSLEYESIMVVRRLDPTIKIGYLLSVNARKPNKLPVDFLSVEASRVNASFMRKARKANQLVYVWTVDKRDDMERLIDLGVDGLITNQSSLVVQLLKERQSMSPREKALRRIRTWLAK